MTKVNYITEKQVVEKEIKKGLTLKLNWKEAVLVRYLMGRCTGGIAGPIFNQFPDHAGFRIMHHHKVPVDSGTGNILIHDLENQIINAAAQIEKSLNS